MTTKKLVFDLLAFAVAGTFLLFFLPYALNAADTFTNVIGLSVIIGVVIGIIAAIHRKFTQNKRGRQ